MSILTIITVHAIARGGKFLRDNIGDAAIAIHNAGTQEILASGATSGASGANSVFQVIQFAHISSVLFLAIKSHIGANHQYYYQEHRRQLEEERGLSVTRL